jgi:hypothetical protein
MKLLPSLQTSSRPFSPLSLRIPGQRHGILWHVAALLIPLLLALLIMWPVPLAMSEQVPGWERDNIAYVWIIYWLKHVFVNGGSIFWDPFAYYPLGYDNATNEVTPANTFLALPVALLFGPVVAYNVMLLLSFALTGYATFLWMKTLTHNNAVALAVGVASAFLPYRIAHLSGHLPQMATQWIPLTFYAVERYASTKRLRAALGIGTAFALTALSSWYSLVFIVLALPVYMLLRLPHLRRWIQARRFWRDMALAATLAAVAILPFAIPHLNAQRRRDMHRDIREIMSLSISPVVFFTLSQRHPVWGEHAAQRIPMVKEQNIQEGVVMPGMLLSALGLAGVVFSRRRRMVRALVGLVIVGMVCAVGPVLVDPSGAPVRVPLSPQAMNWLQRNGGFEVARYWLGAELAGQMQAEGYAVIPLPYMALYRLPVISSIRAVGRFAVLMNLGICGLAALALDAFARRRGLSQSHAVHRARLSVVALAVGVLTVFEFWQLPYETTLLRPRPVDQWLSTQPRGTVVELPPGQSERRLHIFQRIIHQQPVVLGLGGSFPPPADAERLSALRRLPEPDAVKQLCSWQTRYVLLDRSRIKPETFATWQGIIERIPQLHYDRTVGDALVYLARACEMDEMTAHD